MGLLNDKLSALQAGSHVQIVHVSGQVLDGIVAENDGKESLSVQITSVATIRYEQISMINEYSFVSKAIPVVIETSTETVAKTPSPIPDGIGTKEAVAQSFKALNAEEKKALMPANDKFQSYLKSHEESKCKEAVDLIWNILQENEWEYNPRTNLFYANVLMIYGNFYDTVISFFYAGKIREAYNVAYHEAVTSKDKELAQYAAAFSSIYLSDKNAQFLSEAAEVLEHTSVLCADVSGISYAVKHFLSPENKALLKDVVCSLGKQFAKNSTELQDTDKMLIKLQYHYPENEVQKLIIDYFPQIPKITEIVEETPISVTESAPKISVEPSEPDLTKTYIGMLNNYKFYEENGSVEIEDGEKYPFYLKDIMDSSLKKKVKKITSRVFTPIPVEFKLTKRAGKYVAISMKQSSKKIEIGSSAPADPWDEAHDLCLHKKYEQAIEIYRRYLDGDEWEDAFTQIVTCYLALCNEEGDLGSLEELNAFVEKYISQTTKNSKTMEILQQYYMKVQNYSESIHMLNELMELCDPLEHSKILHYLIGKERCYRFMNDYQSAISQLLDWLEIVKRYKIKERNPQKTSFVYIELAELYFETENYEDAEKYMKLASASDRKQALAVKLTAKKAELLPKENLVPEEEEENDETENSPEPEETLQEAYASYHDKYTFQSLGTDDITVLNTALSFRPDQLYCLITYLNTASQLELSSSALKNVSDAFAYAFNSPLLDKEYISTEIMTVFEESKKMLPDLNGKLFASSALHALFNSPTVLDYNIRDFSVVIEECNLEQYSSLLPLMNNLTDFRETTGYGMDVFSDYKTNSTVIESIIAEAKDCCKAIDMRNGVYESQGQVRRMREFMFSGNDSELRICLNIVAENKTEKYQFVKDKISELFIRANKPVSEDYLDVKKVDRYIDDFWDMARDIIQSEGRHISRPHDKIKGSKRNNIIISIRRIISCICDWLSVAEHAVSTDNAFAEKKYQEYAPQVMEQLSELIQVCSNVSEFDWGTESLRRTAQELLDKMKGTYNSKARKYFFIDFLTGEDILLDDNYLPEIQSSFCGMPDFNILYRIHRHASRTHLSLSQRLSEILSNVETKHNFRSARLIRAYGEDMGIFEIAEHKEFTQYHECLKQATQRFNSMYQEFSDELELCESYGTLSNINGEKDTIISVIYAWYRITRLTTDYGFYARLLEIIRNRISLNAVEKGSRLMHKLEELADKPEYDFGVFSKEMIEMLINDQNYTAVEYIMNCIVRGDTKAVADYSLEPFNYFSDFINEHATNYRAVRGAGKDMADTIFEYSGKRDLEKALIYLTNNARKETKGGANLIRSWIPRGGPASPDLLEKLLTRLGFKPVSIKPDTAVDTEAYHVLCRKQIGKVNYVHQIPAFGSKSEQEGFRVLCLYGKYDCDSLMDKFRSVNTTAKNTLVLLDFALNVEERRRLAKKIKEEKTFSKTFIVIDRVILFYLAKHYAENTVIRRMMAVTLPFAYYQPFVESSTQNMPPELFTGREAQLTSIESAEGANLVYGGRQLGKSALLKMAQHNIDKNGNGDRAVLIEIKDRTAAETAKIVSDELIIQGILEESTRCESWAELAGHIKKRLMDENPETRINYLLLMLDEADEFIRTSSETEDPPITALKNLPSSRFKIVMAGLHNLSRYNREMMHMNSNLIHLNSVVIKQFRREEATKLLTNTLAYLGFKFKQNIIDTILASTYNYPGLIQFYCQKLLEAMKNEDYAGYSDTRTPNYEVTESHYKKVLSDTDFTDKVNEKLEATLFTEEKGHSNYHVIALIFAYLYYANPNEKGYTISDLKEVAETYSIKRILSLKPEQLEEILNEMWDLNVLTVMEGYYRFATDGFRELLGSKENVEKAIGDYFEEGDAV